MKKWFHRTLMLTAILIFATLIPVTASAETSKKLEDHVDIYLLEDYLQEQYQKGEVYINLSDFQIPVSVQAETELLIRKTIPETMLHESTYRLYAGSEYITTLWVTYGGYDQAAVRAAGDAILRGIEGNDALTDLEKALLIHDRLALWTEYDMENYMNDTIPDESYSAYGALVKRICVCDGYADAYRYLLSRVGVRCEKHTNYLLDHAWNAVYLDGKAYMVDVTWDDEDNQTGVKHDHFLKSARSGIADELDADLYDTAYDSVWFSGIYYLAGDQVYADNTGLYRLEGTELVEVQDGTGESVYVSNCLELGGIWLMPSWNGIWSMDVSTFEETVVYSAGERVYELRYEGDKIICKIGDGWIEPFADTAHTVTFQNMDGSILQTGTYQFGQLVRPPEDPTMPGYVFTGWNRDITPCTGDTVYTAQYRPSQRPNGWVKENGRWFYIVDERKQTDWLFRDGKWYLLDNAGAMVTGLYVRQDTFAGPKTYYYLDENGIMQTGWQKVDGNWYYFATSGKALTGWQYINYRWHFFNLFGEMKTGWYHEYDTGKTYYLKEHTGMVTGWLSESTEDGTVWYYFGADGARVYGWQTIGGCQYYFDTYGLMQTGWTNKDGKQVYLRSNGIMATGWEKIGEQWYYFQSTGEKSVGWKLIKGCWYYFDQYGRMQTGLVWDGYAQYYMEENGVMQTGWKYLFKGSAYNEGWYYFGTDGKRVTGWNLISGKWYFFTDSGLMRSNMFITSGGQKYYLDANGVMRTGWICVPYKVILSDGTLEITPRWYYANASGILQTGWLKDGNNWYYLDSSGVMQTGWLKQGSQSYYLNSSGIMATGWLKIGTYWYYFNGGGIMQTGWLKYGNSWYYLYSNGRMATGSVIIGNRWYSFNSSGIWIP